LFIGHFARNQKGFIKILLNQNLQVLSCKVKNLICSPGLYSNGKSIFYHRPHIFFLKLVIIIAYHFDERLKQILHKLLHILHL